MSAPTNRNNSNRNLAQGILAYCRESMRTAYGQRDKAYILSDGPDHTGTLVGFVGKVFSTTGDLFPIGRHGNVPNERELHELVRRLPLCMQAFFPDMIYAARISAFHHCYPRSNLAGVDPEKQSAVWLADEVNSLGADMHAEVYRLESNKDIASCGRDAEFNASRVTSQISALLRSSESLTAIRLKLLRRSAECRDESQALDAKQRIFDRKRRTAAARMNRELEPVIDLGLPHTNSRVVRTDVDRYVDALHDKAKDLPVHGFVLSVDYSMFSGLYVEATIFLMGNFAGEDRSVADEFGEIWSRVTDGDGYFLNYNAKGHVLSGVFEAGDPAGLASLMFNLKCAAMKDQFFLPKSAVGMQTFIVETIREPQGEKNVD